MTFRDHMIYCEAYQYTDENFNNLKLIMEMQLQEHFIASHEYLLENYDELSSLNDDSLFQESVSESEIQLITESITDKGKEVLKKLRKTVVDLLKKFITFINKVIGKLTSMDADSSDDEFCESITTEEGKLTTEEVEEIVRIYNECINKSESGENKNYDIVPDANDFRKTKISKSGKTVADIKFEQNVDNAARDNFRKAMYTFKADVIKTKILDGNVGMLDLEGIRNGVTHLKQFMQNPNQKTKYVFKPKPGVIYMYPVKNNDEINKTIEDIKNVCNDIENLSVDDKEPNAEAVKGANDAVNQLSTAAANNYKTYNDINDFRNKSKGALNRCKKLRHQRRKRK